jgi:hypothetical protein
MPADSIPVPVPELSALPEIDGAGLEELPQVVADALGDAGSVDASFPVPSLGTGGSGTLENAENSLISATPEPDITPVLEAATATPLEVPDASPAAVLNAVVTEIASVPVPTSGDDGDVGRTSDSRGAAPGDAAGASHLSVPELASRSEPPSTSPGQQPSVSEINSQRYHNDDLQYQSVQQSADSLWEWSWLFAMDCAGNVTSVATETGSPASLNWVWDWTWEWASCTEPGPSTTNTMNATDLDIGTSATFDGTNVNVSVRVLSPGEDGPVTQTASSDTTQVVPGTGTASPNGIWTWSWTFTFCGATQSFSTQVASGTPLHWLWSWAWSWGCGAAAGPPPDLAGTSPTETNATQLPPLSDVISAIPQALVAPSVDIGVAVRVEPGLSVPALPELLLPSRVYLVDEGIAIVVMPGTSLPALQGLTVPSPAFLGVGVSVVIVPLETSPSPRSGNALTPGPAQTAPARLGAQSNLQPRTTGAVARQHPSSPPSDPSSRPATKRPSAHPAPPRSAGGLLLPFGWLGAAETGGSGTSGGRVPSAPVLAVAALVAFFMLVAPSLGRRLRVARELSPRSAQRSSIDHPG